MLIAVIDKAPSKTNYSLHFNFDFELFHLSSKPITKLLKADVDLELDVSKYDFVILVGSEASKYYAGITSVSTFSGQLVKEKFICLLSPAMLAFKPEIKEDFRKSVDKIHKYISGEIPKSSHLLGDFKSYNDTDKIKKYLKFVSNLADNTTIAVDCETTALYPRDGYVIGVSISHKVGQGVYFSTDYLDEECINLFQLILNRHQVIFHNMKFDIKFIEFHLGVKFNRKNVQDTMLIHYVLNENEEHGLKYLAIKYTSYGDYDKELETFKKDYCKIHGLKQEEFTYDLIPFDIISKYACIDTAVTLELFNKFYPILLKNDKLTWVYENLLKAGTLFFMDMEENGIPISKERMEAADAYLLNEIYKYKEDIFSLQEVKEFEHLQGKKFNPNSVMQLRSLLFDFLGLPPTGKLTDTGGDSLAKDALEELSKKHPLPKAILNYRKLEKVHNTYIAKILPELDNDSCIRTNFNLIFTTSGRASSSGKFNSQQILRDDPIVKGCIQAPPGYMIVSQDLVTAEVYYASVLSKDTDLQSVFRQGGDLHSTIAKLVFDLDCDVSEVKKLYPELRQAAKAITFGILYGSGPAKVSETVSEAIGREYPIERAKDDIKQYFIRFNKLRKWLDSRKEFISTNGYTYSFFGRKRRLPNVFSTDKQISSHEIRSGINAEIQSLASDVNLLAAIDMHNYIQKSKTLDAKIFMLVHDSIVSLVKTEHVPEYKEKLKYFTQLDRGCSISGVPIGIDQTVGSDYSFGDFDNVYRLDKNSVPSILYRK